MGQDVINGDPPDPAGKARRMEMKHRAWVIIVVVIAALSALGCVCGQLALPIGVVRGSGQVVTEEREIGGATGVDLQSFGTVHIEQGERVGLRVEAEDNLLRYIETDVREGRLEIAHRRGTRLLNTKPIDYWLTVRDLDEVSISGAGNVEADDLQAGRLTIRLSGAGSVHIEDLEAETLYVTLSGAGGLSIEGGVVERQEVVISGAGDYRAQDLDSGETTIRLSGMGSATVRVRERLDVTISGAGSVRYRGDPEVDQQITGAGRVQRIGE
jgi:hypothetical protein